MSKIIWLLLPSDILLDLLMYFDVEDILNFSRSCKEAWNCIMTEVICKVILRTSACYSHEAQRAIAGGYGYASGLRRVVKRRQAVAAGLPYVVATVAFGDAYIYCNGFLCYTLDENLRILDVHRSVKNETVVKIPNLILTVLPGLVAVEESQLLSSNQQARSSSPFKVLYCSQNIIACLYTPSLELTTSLRAVDADSPILESTSWLIAFDINSYQILTHKGFNSDHLCFVRHNRKYLYYGVRQDQAWVVHGHEFGRLWYDPFPLQGIFGSEIGSQVCFEIFDEYFYALSNQTSPEVEEIDWTSFYTSLRFPLEAPCNEVLERTQPETMWRKEYVEGCNDERWTTICLYKDETTGQIRIAESRKDLYYGGGHARKCFTNDVIFPEQGGLGLPFFSINESGTLPEARILRLRQQDDHPHYFPPLPRRPEDVHPDTDNLIPTIHNVPLRYYSTSATAFINLIDSPIEGRQSLRLRVQSRRFRSPRVYPSTHPNAGLLLPQSSNLPIAIREMYKDYIAEWPPAPDPSSPEQSLDTIRRLLNPPSHLGHVTGTADERSMVYMTGSGENNAPQAIVLISFDPAIKLLGVGKRGDGLDRMDGIQRDGVVSCSLSADANWWIQKEKPMYTDIGLGVYLGC